MAELQSAYDGLKSDSERKIADLQVQIVSADPSTLTGKVSQGNAMNNDPPSNVKQSLYL